ncbi:MAG: hypothetical protein QNK37_23830 [Acidobacteriota bacterium]|nr:hypothetical protein [Acidobacteriota bacterium]
MNLTTLDHMQQRAFRASLDDGLTEILLAPVLFAAAVSLIQPSFTWLPGVTVLMSFPLMRLLRRRITFPRIGVVIPKRESTTALFQGMFRFTLAILLGAGLLFVVFGDVTDPLTWRRFSPVIAAALMTGGFQYAAQRSGCRRFQIINLAAVLLSVVCCLAVFPQPYGHTALFLTLLSLVLLGSGLIVLYRFRRMHPPAEADHD